jgi:hypothetical protein
MSFFAAGSVPIVMKAPRTIVAARDKALARRMNRRAQHRSIVRLRDRKARGDRHLHRAIAKSKDCGSGVFKPDSCYISLELEGHGGGGLSSCHPLLLS